MISKDEAYKSWEKAFLGKEISNKEDQAMGFVQVGNPQEPIMMGVLTTNSECGQIVTTEQMASISTPPPVIAPTRQHKGWPKGKKRGS